MGSQNDSAAAHEMSRRSWLFVGIVVVLGLVQLAAVGFGWHSTDSRRFLTYLAIVAVAGFFHLNRTDRTGGISMNLPFVLLSIVDLSLPEAVTIGCVAAVIQSLQSPEGRSFRRLMLSLGVQATVISTACFVLGSLLPARLNDPPFRLFVAAMGLFMANTFPAAIMFRLTGEQRLGNVWKSSYFWAFPYYLVGAALAQVIHSGKSALSGDTSLLVLAALYLAYRNYRAQKKEWSIREKHAEDVAALHLRAIEGLALAVEAKDNRNTRGHIRRVQVYALGIGKAMGLTGPGLEALRAGALLHDIGKLAVPEHILTKPGKLTPEEFAKMKVHPLVGAEIVDQMQFPYPVAPIVRAHHEKWDGSGYPFGLSGESIPLGARILTAADWLDAMISDREYRKGIPIDDAMKQMSAESGKSFDPKVVEILLQQYKALEQRATAQAEQGPVLSTEILVANGLAPDAGLDLCGLPQAAHGEDFLTTITEAAREEQLMRDTAAAGASLDTAETMTRIDEALRRKIPYDALVFFVRHANALNAEHATGKNASRLSSLEVLLGEGLTGWVGQNLQPVVNGNPAADPGFECSPEEPLKSVLAIPGSGPAGLVAVLALYRARKDSFSRGELELVLAVAPNITAALQNALTHRDVELKTNLDKLTGTFNRTQLLRFLDEELSRGRRDLMPVALVLAELRGFQEMADSIGYSKRDDLLVAIAKGLRKVSREYDRLGRLGDNRFAMVLPGMKPSHVVTILDRLHEIVAGLAKDVCGSEIQLQLAGAFYPDDGDGGRNLMLVAERKLEGPDHCWEESLRALMRVGEPPAGSSEGELTQSPNGRRREDRDGS